MGVAGILCSFRLVLDRKAVKKIPESSRLEFLKMFSANHFSLLDLEDNAWGLLNRAGVIDLTLENTVNNSRWVNRENWCLVHTVRY